MIRLMRHGETEHQHGFYGRTDSQLTERGKQQMRSQAQGLLPDAIITSPKQRCMHIAQQLGQELSRPLLVEEDWQEYDFGAWEGKSIQSLWQTQPDALTAFWETPHHFTPPDAEPFAAFMQRIERVRSRLMQHHQQYPSLLVVTHAGVIRLLRLLAGQTSPQHWLEYPVPHASLHSLCPTSYYLLPA